MLGILLMVALEQGSVILMNHAMSPTLTAPNNGTEAKKSGDNNEVEIEMQVVNHADHHLEGHIHTHSLDMVADYDASKAFFKSLIMEISIAIHSVIIGFDMGALGNDDLMTIRALMIAFVFHQFFEGVGLGSVISETRLSLATIAAFALFFSSTLPMGVVIGMTTSESSAGVIIREVANALAAGSLLYTGLVEMAAEDFADPILRSKPFLKLEMIVAMFMGAFFMALLANWA